MIPKSHPRYESLLLRDKIVKASQKGYLADSGMIAHGRGEAFDYLIGEKTTYPAKRAMYVAVAALLLSNNPVISVNGNASALACDEIIELAQIIDAKIEINLFYRTDERIKLLTKLYKDHGCKDILGTLDDDIEYINDIKNNRASASKTGIYSADTVLVPLEDGDRAEILKKSGKNIITIDLNPLSRTSKMSDVSIMDNIVRAIPYMTKIAEDLKTQDKQILISIVNEFDNEENLKESLQQIKIKEWIKMQVMGISGLPGSGKGLVSDMATERGAIIVSMGDIIREEAKKRGESTKETAKNLRKEKGEYIVSELTIKKIKQLEKEGIENAIVVDGIRSHHEVEMFKENFDDFIILSIFANPTLRFKRLQNRMREDDSKDYKEFAKRDQMELDFGIGNVIALSDKLIINESDLESYSKEINEFLKEINL